MRAKLRHLYGPVPSRRLGRSLGVDLIPFKTCSYDCVYCQLGRTTAKTIHRREWVPLAEVRAELDEVLRDPSGIDIITLAGAGEPTLHSGIGELILWLKGRTSLPVAVLTNGGMLWRSDVRDDLAPADLVVPSLDVGDPASFHYVNRPHRKITFEAMVAGLETFTHSFEGRLWLEVLLIDGVTGVDEEVAAIAALARRIGPEKVQLGTLTRPPAEEDVQPVPRDELERFRLMFDPPAELIGVADVPADSRDRGLDVDDLLAMLQRRPCTVTDLSSALGVHDVALIKVLAELADEGEVRIVNVGTERYYRAAAATEAS